MSFLRDHRGPLLGAAVLHVGLLVVAALWSLQWTREQPPVQLAIEATVVDESTLKPTTRRAPSVPTAPPPAARSAPVDPEPAVTPPPEPDPAVVARERERAEAERAAEAAAAERRRLDSEQAAQRERAAAEAAAAQARAAQEAAAAKARADAEAKARAKAEAEAKARAAAEAEALERRRREELLAREQQAEIEADLQRQVEAEEAEASALAQSGVLDSYRRDLQQAIERNWLRPVTARAGLECELHVAQAAGGTVLGVRIGRCNGDAAVRESIVTAVHRASPLPLPSDPRAFQRELVIVFKPTE